MPDFADPARKGNKRGILPEEERMGDELIPKKVRDAKAAKKDDILATIPDVRPLEASPHDHEPIDPKNKVFKSPVFLVDPKFTMDMKEEDRVDFHGHDFGGHKQPHVDPKWPIVQKEVKSFFGVGDDCSACGMAKKTVFALEPRVEPLRIPTYYAPVYEPQYENPHQRIPHYDRELMKDMIYKGDDYGGHNIPYPHPEPPKPHPRYDQDAFISLTSIFDTDGHLKDGATIPYVEFEKELAETRRKRAAAAKELHEKGDMFGKEMSKEEPVGYVSNFKADKGMSYHENSEKDHEVHHDQSLSALDFDHVGFESDGHGLGGDGLKGVILHDAPEAPKELHKSEFDHKPSKVEEEDIDFSSFSNESFSQDPMSFVGGFDEHLAAGPQDYGKGAIGDLLHEVGPAQY